MNLELKKVPDTFSVAVTAFPWPCRGRERRSPSKSEMEAGPAPNGMRLQKHLGGTRSPHLEKYRRGSDGVSIERDLIHAFC